MLRFYTKSNDIDPKMRMSVNGDTDNTVRGKLKKELNKLIIKL